MFGGCTVVSPDSGPAGAAFKVHYWVHHDDAALNKIAIFYWDTGTEIRRRSIRRTATPRYRSRRRRHPAPVDTPGLGMGLLSRTENWITSSATKSTGADTIYT